MPQHNGGWFSPSSIEIGIDFQHHLPILVVMKMVGYPMIAHVSPMFSWQAMAIPYIVLFHQTPLMAPRPAWPCEFNLHKSPKRHHTFWRTSTTFDMAPLWCEVYRELKNTSRSEFTIIFSIASCALTNLSTMKIFVANHVSIGRDNLRVGLYQR